MKSLGSLRLQPYDEIEINKCKNVEQRFVCIHCIEICFSIEKLKLHYVNVHGYKSPESEKKVTTKVCSICRMSFKNAKTLSKHVKTVHYKIMSFICSVCSKQFSRKATLDVSFRSIFIAAVLRLCIFLSRYIWDNICQMRRRKPSVVHIPTVVFGRPTPASCQSTRKFTRRQTRESTNALRRAVNTSQFKPLDSRTTWSRSTTTCLRRRWSVRSVSSCQWTPRDWGVIWMTTRKVYWQSTKQHRRGNRKLTESKRVKSVWTQAWRWEIQSLALVRSWF